MLYQFECHRCKKPMNQSLLFNDALLLDSNDDNSSEYIARSGGDSPHSLSKLPSPVMTYQQCDSNGRYSSDLEEPSTLFHLKTKDFRESLINFNANYKREVSQRHNNEKVRNGILCV